MDIFSMVSAEPLLILCREDLVALAHSSSLHTASMGRLSQQMLLWEREA